MKHIIFSLFKQLFFWLLFFAVNRFIFLMSYTTIISEQHISISEIINGFYHAMNLDLATASYLLIIPLLLSLIESVYSISLWKKINRIYTVLILVIYNLIAATEIGVYAEWKTKITYKSLSYLKHPDEIFNSASTSQFIILLLFVIGITLIFYKIHNYFIFQSTPSKKVWRYSPLVIISITPLLVLGMRGGVQEIPINQSQSFYSKHDILNCAATNTGFNLYISIYENIKNLNKNPFEYYPVYEADSIVQALLNYPTDSTIQILNTNRPNIVLLILESWSADLIESLGGKPGVTPQFKALEKEGFLFTNIYASGMRSEQGMASIFSGFPAHPISSATVQPDKQRKLNTLTQTLNKEGYTSSFYFGGQLIYGNIKSYIIHNQFDKILEIYDFSDTLPQGKLGIHDEFTLNQQLNDLNSEKQPFFSALFTLSSHSPYDQPMQNAISWGGNENDYLNSAYYSDYALGQFFSNAKNEPWYDNTLFILVADHSHNSYNNWHIFHPNYHRIPMLFYGNVIKPEYRGTQWTKLGSQTDLTSTLLHQLSISADTFFWSKNLLNLNCPEFAYYSYEEGLGWVKPYGYFAYEKRYDRMHHIHVDSLHRQQLIHEGKAYQEMVFKNYLDL